MTITQIHVEVSRARPVTLRQLWRWVKKLNIKPLGIRQRPQQYPEDSAELIITALGLTRQPKASIPTMKQLKAEKRKAKL